MDDFTRWEEYVPQAYQKICETDTDILAIANNPGWTEYRIRCIKNHIFYQEHQLEIRYGRFDPDPDIADAWKRLYQGDYFIEDLHLLEHEYFEARFENIFHTNYRTAHEVTLRSGRIWNPPLVTK